MSTLSKQDARQRRHNRLRKKVIGTAQRPRMAVFRSNKHLYVQLIDDDKGHTMASTSTLDAKYVESGAGSNVGGAEILGRIAAEKALAVGITEVVFDRGGFAFHGKIKALAESARKTGLKF